MIAKITPLLRMPSNLDLFDYLVLDEMQGKIKIGQLVSIPWQNRKLPGVVLSLEENFPTCTQGGIKGGSFRIRPIHNIIDENPVLSNAQMKLIKTFSEYYFCTQGYVARLITPDKPKRKIRPQKTYDLGLRLHNFTISKSQLKDLNDSLVSLRGRLLPTLAIPSSTHCALDTGLPRRPEYRTPRNDMVIQDVSSFIWLILSLIKETKGQVLVMFPTIDLINAIASVVQKKCSDKLAVIHSELSMTQYWNQYQKILTGEGKIILSTRQGVFLPILDNSKIIFFESTSQDFKQYDQHPRYDARIVASWVSRITNSDLIFASASESLLVRHPLGILGAGSERGYCRVKGYTKLSSACNIKTQTKLIDMKQEMSKKDFSIIADSVLDNIKKIIAQNKKVLIISLRQDADQGVSVNKIAEILTNQIKNCTISTKYDSNQSFDILVTTAYPLEALKLSSLKHKFGLAIFASIEPLLAIPDFRSGERAFNRLNFWKIMCAELQIEQIILQSYSPENSAIRAFAYGEVESFFKSELDHRKQLNYPPFGQLIKLSLSRHSEQGEAEVKNLVDNVRALLTRSFPTESASQDDASILGPFKDKKNQQSLLIKTSKDTDLKIMKSLPHGWTIDRDPENIL
ncbi:MAG: hypothetical protein COW93_00875 [Parcubacteria group bacterium CG22_combo_CG10-13_8_21_14_all_41_9]|nr:MAG: hypothetical protein COW93_00875 [Parcubacteria group bacterium CG22_combo_CG10-13_8_21_14_all_41_9]